MQLYVLRHAKAVTGTPGQADTDRPLAPRGEAAGHALAEHIDAARLRCDLALCSPARRTRQTLALVRAAFGGPAVRYDERLYAAPVERIVGVLTELEPTAEAVLVVGHNPGLHLLAFELSGDGEPDALAHLATEYPTAGLATLRIDVAWEQLTSGCGFLESFVVPRALG
jgi:phosphohistidine phosphatase